jgi:hypothetical protein
MFEITLLCAQPRKARWTLISLQLKRNGFVPLLGFVPLGFVPLGFVPLVHHDGEVLRWQLLELQEPRDGWETTMTYLARAIRLR